MRIRTGLREYLSSGSITGNTDSSTSRLKVFCDEIRLQIYQKGIGLKNQYSGVKDFGDMILISKGDASILDLEMKMDRDFEDNESELNTSNHYHSKKHKIDE